MLRNTSIKIMQAWRAWYFCLTWPWHNCRTRVFRTERQHFACCSTNYAFKAQCVWYTPANNQRRVVSCPLPSLFILFWVFRYVHTPLRSLYLLSTFNAAHVRGKRILGYPYCTTSMFPFWNVGEWEWDWTAVTWHHSVQGLSFGNTVTFNCSY